MSGHIIFFTGAALICFPRVVSAFSTFASGLPWLMSAAGAALFLNLAYCAWRGERWAYYLLMFLCILGLALSAVLLPTAKTTAELVFRILEILGVALGAGLTGLHPRSKEFMHQQSIRFRAN